MSTKEEQKQHLIDIMKGDEGLRLYELEEKLDIALENETSESLNSWLKEKRETMAQQTSVEWLIDKVFDHTLHKDMGQTFTQARKMYKEEKMYSEEDMIDFSEWVSLNFPNQHNYLRNLQKRSQGLDVPVEKFQGYRTTKELFEQFKKQ